MVVGVDNGIDQKKNPTRATRPKPTHKSVAIDF